MLVIYFINICIVLIGSLVFRFTINVNRLEAQESEVRKFERNLKEAKIKTDKASLRKLKREEVRIKRISALASKQRLKVVMITILPFTATTLLLGAHYGGSDIALFPFELPLFSKDYLGRTTVPFSVWYFLSYFSAYLPISKVFRSSPSFWQSSDKV